MIRKITCIIGILVLLLPISAFASEMRCEYKLADGNVTLTLNVNYKYGNSVTYEAYEERNSVKTSVTFNNFDLANIDFVDENSGELFCPNIKLKHKRLDKNKWSWTFNSDLSAEGTLIEGNKIIILPDNKEVETPFVENHVCVYNQVENNKDREYTLLWDGEKVVINATGKDFAQICETSAIGFTAEDFSNMSCPKVYDDYVIGKDTTSNCKGKLIVNKNPNFTNSDSSTRVNEIRDVNNPRVTYTTKPHGVNDEPVDCGMLPAEVQTLLKNILTLIKYAGPILVIVFTIIDLIKASVSGEAEELKKVSSRFVKRIIAAALLFFIPIIINIIFDFFEITSPNCSALAIINILSFK